MTPVRSAALPSVRMFWTSNRCSHAGRPLRNTPTCTTFPMRPAEHWSWTSEPIAQRAPMSVSHWSSSSGSHFSWTQRHSPRSWPSDSGLISWQGPSGSRSRRIRSRPVEAELTHLPRSAQRGMWVTSSKLTAAPPTSLAIPADNEKPPLRAGCRR